MKKKFHFKNTLKENIFKSLSEKLIADFSLQLASKKDNMIDINLKSFVKTDEGKELLAPQALLSPLTTGIMPRLLR